jgi:hypothetical protein
MQARLLPLVGPAYQARRLKLVTLTQQAVHGEKYADALERLSKAWKKLSRRVGWTRHVEGGLRATEATWNASKGWWHVHAHVLVDSDYFPKDELSELWTSCSPGSFISDIREATGSGPEDVLHEVLKYCTKAWEVPGAKVIEMLEGMASRRLVQTFGTWYDAKDDVEDEDQADEIHVLVGIGAVESLVRLGDPLDPVVQEARIALATAHDRLVRALQWKKRE